MLYTVLYMASIRTQIYLTRDQRAKLDEIRQRERKSLAQLIRDAIDAFLQKEGHDDAGVDEMLAESFGAIPDLEVPSRDEWDRGYG